MLDLSHNHDRYVRVRARHSRVRILFGARRLALCAALLALVPADAQAASISSADPCLSFLSSGFTSGSPGETDQRSAGIPTAAGKKAATLSLLLGIRLALGPAEDMTGGDDTANARRDVTALDIQRYRTCKKERALRVSYLP